MSGMWNMSLKNSGMWNMGSVVECGIWTLKIVEYAKLALKMWNMTIKFLTEYGCCNLNALLNTLKSHIVQHQTMHTLIKAFVRGPILRKGYHVELGANTGGSPGGVGALGDNGSDLALGADILGVPPGVHSYHHAGLISKNADSCTVRHWSLIVRPLWASSLWIYQGS